MTVELHTERLLLVTRAPQLAERVQAFYLRNRERLEAVDPPRPEGFFTLAYWRARVEQDLEDLEDGRALRFRLLLRDEPEGPVVGAVSFNQVIRGPLCQSFLGYAIDGAHEGRGLMHEALAGALPFAFDHLGLHRVSANYLPTNERSGRLLRRLGFVVEGYARDYLYVGGAWRDHVMTALVEPTGRPPTIG